MIFFHSLNNVLTINTICLNIFLTTTVKSMATKKKQIRKTKKVSKKQKIEIEDSDFVINNLMLPLVFLDHEGIIRKVNVSWIEAFGKVKKNYIGLHYFEFLKALEEQGLYPAETRNKIQNILQKAISGNFKPKFLEFPMKGGWYLSHMHPVHKKSKLNGFVITHHNVTVWKQKEIELQKEKQETFENSQRKMFFLANLNHELKSPLNSILGFSQLLREEFEKNHQLESYAGMIDNITEATNHLRSIVFRILNMAKIESGTLTLNEERVVPAKLIQLCLNMIQPMFPDRVIQVEVCPQAAQETLKCDKNLAMEVLMNLLVNSLKFSQEPVRIKCLLDEHKNLEFHVTDTGMGMTEKEVCIALEPFGQNIRSPNDKHTGLGLGVPFSNQIMKLHGGDLKIQSEKGTGTSVCAVFPASRIVI